MTSTLLDVTICLLLISAGVVSLTAASPDEPSGRGAASAVAETLATSTTSVHYTLGTGQSDTPSSNQTPVDQQANGRTAHGTLATLLGEATVHAVTVRADRPRRDGFVRAVRRAVVRAVGSDRRQIVAAWRPFPGSHLGARLEIGPDPPADADVRAATIQVDCGVGGGQSAAVQTTGEGFGTLAATLADRSVRTLLPVEASPPVARAERPVSPLAERRYRATARQYGVAVELSSVADVRETRRRLERAIRTRFGRELRRTYGSTEEATDAVSVDRIDIVVRTWR